MPFLNHGRIPIGSLGTYVQSFRFNDPVFATLERVAAPQLVAGLAVLVGFLTAIWMRRKAPTVFSGRICLAHGSIASLCTGRISVVPALAAAVRAVGLDGADHHLDSEHHPHLLRLAFARRLGVRGWFPAGLCCWNTDPWQRPVQLSCFAGSGNRPCPNNQGQIISCCCIPKSSARHPKRHPFNSPRSELYEKCPLFNHDGSSCFAECWSLLHPPGRRRARQFSNRSPRPMVSIRSGKLRRSATPGTGKSPDSSKLSRTWEWEPKTGKVSFEGKDKDGKPVKVTYMRSEINDDTKKQTDAGFTNDNYWLLFPLHAYWDTSATVTDEGMKKLPAGAGSATLVSVKYGAELGGYTPGDTWDLYVGKDNRVEYLVFHHGGDKEAKPRQRNMDRLQKGWSSAVSQPSTAAPPMASLCTSSFLTWRSS